MSERDLTPQQRLARMRETVGNLQIEFAVNNVPVISTVNRLDALQKDLAIVEDALRYPNHMLFRSTTGKTFELSNDDIQEMQDEISAQEREIDQLRSAASSALRDFKELVNPTWEAQLNLHPFTLTTTELETALGEYTTHESTIGAQIGMLMARLSVMEDEFKELREYKLAAGAEAQLADEFRNEMLAYKGIVKALIDYHENTQDPSCDWQYLVDAARQVLLCPHREHGQCTQCQELAESEKPDES